MKRRSLKKTVKRSENNQHIFFGVLLGVGIVVILLLIPGMDNDDVAVASASTVIREEVDPEEYQDLTYPTVDDAIMAANGQLSQMTVGNIHTIDDNDDDFTGRLFLDHMRGGVIYWELSDPETIVYLDAYSSEIYLYDQAGWSDGDIDQQEAETQAEIIAEQFSVLPVDSTGPETNIKESSQSIGVDPETNEVVYDETYTHWVVVYERLINGILTEDNIRMKLNPNGYLCFYGKIWNMDPSGLDTTYSVTQSEAETTALDHAGSGSQVKETTTKMIVRPDYFWTGTEGRTFGSDPVCVWYVCIEDPEHNLRIYYIHSTSNTIVGGDFSAFFYGSDIEEGE